LDTSLDFLYPLRRRAGFRVNELFDKLFHARGISLLPLIVQCQILHAIDLVTEQHKRSLMVEVNGQIEWLEVDWWSTSMPSALISTEPVPSNPKLVNLNSSICIETVFLNPSGYGAVLD
jgi:hypothetical protein